MPLLRQVAKHKNIREYRRQNDSFLRGWLPHSAPVGDRTQTSRLRIFIMAKVSHALNHSAMEAELTTSHLHSFIMAKVSHALNHSAMEAVLTSPP